MFTWIRRCCRCKVILPVLSAASITLFSIVPFSASAETVEDPFDSYKYLLLTDDLFEVFPYDLPEDDVGQTYNEVVFYENNDFHVNSDNYVRKKLSPNDISEGGTNSYYTWDCYWAKDPDFACKSAFADFCLAPLYFDTNTNYIFDFYLKFNGNNGIISSGFYLDQINLEFANDGLSVLSFHPSSIYGNSNNVVTHFQFVVPGSYLDELDEHVIKLYFHTDEYMYCSATFLMWLDPSHHFSIRYLTPSEDDYYTESLYTANAIAGIGSNVPPVDMSGPGSDVQNLTDTAAAIDDQYALDPGQTSEAMSNAASLFSESGFVNASNVIKTWINQFLDSNASIYSMFVCCLGLGLAFFAIGRSSSG